MRRANAHTFPVQLRHFSASSHARIGLSVLHVHRDEVARVGGNDAILDMMFLSVAMINEIQDDDMACIKPHLTYIRTTVGQPFVM